MRKSLLLSKTATIILIPMALLFVGSLLLISLPWILYIDFKKTLLSLLLLWILIFIIPKVKNYGKVIGVCLLLLSLSIFIFSIFNISSNTRLSVELQRRFADKSSIKIPQQIFINKFIESYRFREGLLFENLDFGNYFFIGHPRERGGVIEILKVWLAFLPLIILGLAKLDYRKRWLILSLGLLSVIYPVALTDRSTEAGFLLIIPIAYLSAKGAIYLFKESKNGKIFLGLLSLIFLFEILTFYEKI